MGPNYVTAKKFLQRRMSIVSCKYGTRPFALLSPLNFPPVFSSSVPNRMNASLFYQSFFLDLHGEDFFIDGVEPSRALEISTPSRKVKPPSNTRAKRDSFPRAERTDEKSDGNLVLATIAAFTSKYKVFAVI